MTNMLQILYILIIFLLICFPIKKYVFQICMTWKLPGPKWYPIIGHGLLFLNKSSVENFQMVQKILNEYGEIVRIWLGIDLIIALHDPRDVEIVLRSTKFIEKSTEYKFIRPWLHDGILTSHGKKWHQRRKILIPAFHFKILEQFVEIFDRQSNVFIETLLKHPQKEKVEMYPLVTLCVLDVTCESAMGTSANAQTNSQSDYVKAVNDLAHVLHLRMFRFWLRYDLFFQFSETARIQAAALKTLHAFTDKAILNRRAELLSSNDALEQSSTTSKKSAFLDVLLKSSIDGKPLTNLDIREEVDTFMFAGHDTTTSAITFCLYCIAKNQSVQDKCFEEIRAVIGDDKTKAITMTDVNNLIYLELVIKETLRLFPPVPLIGRKVSEQVTINGNTYPPGANIVIPIYHMGHDSKKFKNPEHFNPERFQTNGMPSDFNRFSYIPFSGGIRNCIGQKFAHLVLKSIVSKVLRYFEIGLCADSEQCPLLCAELTLIPKSKINFKLTERLY